MEQYGKQELMHYEFPENRSRFDSAIATIAAQVADTTDGVIVQAVIKAASDMGITDLYLIDKKFIQEALSEKLARAKNDPRTIEELRQMDGEPVWIADTQEWGIVKTSYGGLKNRRPLILVVGNTIEFIGRLKIYRQKPAEG